MYQALSVILQWEPGNEANDYCCSTLLLCVVKTALALTSVSIQPSTTLVVVLNPRLQLCIGADVSVNSALTSGYIGADVSVNSVSIQRQPQATAMHWLWRQCQFSVNSASTSGYSYALVMTSVSIQCQPQATAMHWCWHQCHSVCQFSNEL